MIDTSPTHKQKELFKTIKSKRLEDWVTSKLIISAILQETPQFPLPLQQDLYFSLDSVGNLLTLLLLYTHHTKSISSGFIDQLKRLQKVGELQRVEKWMSLQSSVLRQQATELVLQALTLMLQKDARVVKAEELGFLLARFNQFQIQRQRDMTVVTNFMGRLQQVSVSGNGQSGELMMMMSICQLLTQKISSGNLSLIFDQFILTQTDPRIVQRFVSIHSQFLLELDQTQALSILRGLTRRGLSGEILSFVQCFSRLLAEDQQFYKLRHLYEQWVLPQLCRRAKACHQSNTQQVVLSICEFFVIGFLHHCNLGLAGFACLLYAIEDVKGKQERSRWVALCSLVCEKQDILKKALGGWLDERKERVQEGVRKTIVRNNQVFQITTRSIKKRTAYRMEGSLLKGIINHQQQCYIVSVVQALYHTKGMGLILQRTYSKASSPLALQLTRIFKELSDASSPIPSVDDLQRKGPQEFAKSKNQQDAQNYLIRVMEQLEKQLKQQGLLGDFKSTFQIETKDSLCCCMCSYRTEDLQYEYVHTIPHTQPLSLLYDQDINDYPCPKCQERCFRKRTQLSLKGSIFIVHINRFSVSKGSTHKELPTQPIMRKIEDYELVGIIFHIGKRIGCGHYTYYGRVSPTRWAEMNDAVVREFSLSSESQQFEGNMKAEKTPYILFYQKQNSID